MFISVLVVSDETCNLSLSLPPALRYLLVFVETSRRLVDCAPTCRMLYAECFSVDGKDGSVVVVWLLLEPCTNRIVRRHYFFDLKVYLLSRAWEILFRLGLNTTGLGLCQSPFLRPEERRAEAHRLVEHQACFFIRRFQRSSDGAYMSWSLIRLWMPMCLLLRRSFKSRKNI